MKLMGHGTVTVSQGYGIPMERAVSRMEAYNMAGLNEVGTELDTVDIADLAVGSKVV
jgi:hypothetical protein